MKKISVLGSTGSIGIQTLDVVRNTNVAEVIAIAGGGNNIELLEEQILEFKPKLCAVFNEKAALSLKDRMKNTVPTCEIVSGVDGIIECAGIEDTDTCVAAIVGAAGIKPVLEAIKRGKNVALANKETLVAAGSIVMEAAHNKGVTIFPVDSEHSAIFQCIAGNKKQDIERIILTASGGPFKGCSEKELQCVTAEDALRHPTWNMGKKITIDSATLMNKGLEVIEASWLFDMPGDKITPMIHPQSVIHSMVEYKDGTVMAQMGTPDMRLPISLALTWPERTHYCHSKLDLIKYSNLTFKEPDIMNFRCLVLAFEAMKAGGIMPAVMNGANEICVQLFLEGRIGFLQIAKLIEETMEAHCNSNTKIQSIDQVLEADKSSRNYVKNRFGGV